MARTSNLGQHTQKRAKRANKENVIGQYMWAMITDVASRLDQCKCRPRAASAIYTLKYFDISILTSELNNSVIIHNYTLQWQTA